MENRGDGAPTSIVVKGPVKCAICEGFTEDRLICEGCTEAVTFLRAADNLANFRELIKFATRPGTLAVLKLLTDDALTDVMMKRIEDARSRA